MLALSPFPALDHVADFGAEGSPWLLLIPLVGLLLIGLVIFLVARRWRRRGGGPAAWRASALARTATQSAESTLADRFARGEIDDAEYRSRLAVLRNHPGEPAATAAQPQV